MLIFRTTNKHDFHNNINLFFLLKYKVLHKCIDTQKFNKPVLIALLVRIRFNQRCVTLSKHNNKAKVLPTSLINITEKLIQIS